MSFEQVNQIKGYFTPGRFGMHLTIPYVNIRTQKDSVATLSYLSSNRKASLNQVVLSNYSSLLSKQLNQHHEQLRAMGEDLFNICSFLGQNDRILKISFAYNPHSLMNMDLYWKPASSKEVYFTVYRIMASKKKFSYLALSAASLSSFKREYGVLLRHPGYNEWSTLFDWMKANTNKTGQDWLSDFMTDMNILIRLEASLDRWALGVRKAFTQIVGTNK